MRDTLPPRSKDVKKRTWINFLSDLATKKGDMNLILVIKTLIVKCHVYHNTPLHPLNDLKKLLVLLICSKTRHLPDDTDHGHKKAA